MIAIGIFLVATGGEVAHAIVAGQWRSLIQIFGRPMTLCYRANGIVRLANKQIKPATLSKLLENYIGAIW